MDASTSSESNNGWAQELSRAVPTEAFQRVRANPAVAAIASRLRPVDPVWPAPPVDPERGVVRQAAVAVIIRLPAIQVRPIVAIVPTAPELVPGPEVRATFWVPLRALAADTQWRPTQVDAGGTPLTVPAFLHEEYVIWGLTARIIRSFVALLPPDTIFSR